jgi:hypothetical protein
VFITVFYLDESSFYPARKGKSWQIYANQDLNGLILIRLVQNRGADQDRIIRSGNPADQDQDPKVGSGSAPFRGLALPSDGSSATEA